MFIVFERKELGTYHLQGPEYVQTSTNCKKSMSCLDNRSYIEYILEV